MQVQKGPRKSCRKSESNGIVYPTPGDLTKKRTGKEKGKADSKVLTRAGRGKESAHAEDDEMDEEQKAE